MSDRISAERLSRGFSLFYLAVCLWGIIDSYLYGDLYYRLLSFAGPFMLLIPPVFCRLTRLNTDPIFVLAINVFTFFACVLGISFRWYQASLIYDKLVHTLAGVVLGLGGMILYFLMKNRRPFSVEDLPFLGFFILASAGLGGVLWEIWEYAADLLFRSDPQNVLTTGVHDTMQDMIVCLLGGVYVLWELFWAVKKKKSGPVMTVFSAIYRINQN